MTENEPTRTTAPPTDAPRLPIPFVMMAASAMIAAGSGYQIPDDEFARIEQLIAPELSREALCNRKTDIFSAAWTHAEDAVTRAADTLLAHAKEHGTHALLNADSAICTIRLESIRSALLVGLIAGHHITRIIDDSREGGTR